MTHLAIFDYGAGNIFSLRNSVERIGATTGVITDFDGIRKFDGLLLPGVGNFDPAMDKVTAGSGEQLKLDSVPILGICLGMEMFFESSQEGVRQGLGIINGNVVSLPDSMKVPHMGWNSLDIKKEGTLLRGISSGSWVYFVHSFMTEPKDDKIITATSDYGRTVPAVIEQGNYLGTQFHPEKSGETGRIILRNFLGVCRK